MSNFIDLNSFYIYLLEGLIKSTTPQRVGQSIHIRIVGTQVDPDLDEGDCVIEFTLDLYLEEGLLSYKQLYMNLHQQFKDLDLDCECEFDVEDILLIFE